jgi:hybrid cluster-associated redox disulfide protein
MDNKLFTLQTNMAKLLEDAPQCIPVLLKYHMGCVGCAMAPFDTINDVIRIYSLPQEEFLSDLHNALYTPDAGR